MLNFAKNDDFQKALDFFGGENLLKSEYPAILQMLNNTKQMHQKKADNTTEEIGYTDTCRIEMLPTRMA